MQITMTESEFAAWKRTEDTRIDNLNAKIVQLTSTSESHRRERDTANQKVYEQQNKLDDQKYEIQNFKSTIENLKRAAETLKVTTDAALADAKKQIIGPDAASELKVLIATAAVGNPKFNKIDVIRSVRLLLGGDLKQAKDLVEEALAHPTVTASLKKTA
jgi:ribosomal protein L7/L12